MWIADTGAGQHLCSENDVTPEALSGITPCPETKLSTANGIVDARGQLELFMPKLGIGGKFLLLDNCPPVLSVGRLVEDHGFEFRWSRRDAWLRTPDHRRIKLVVQGYVPMLRARAEAGHNVRAAPDEDAHGCAVEHVPVCPGCEEAPGQAPPAAEVSQVQGADDAAQVRSLRHLLCHLPKSPNCPICTEGKVKAKPARRRREPVLSDVDSPQKWGDLLLADTLLLH